MPRVVVVKRNGDQMSEDTVCVHKYQQQYERARVNNENAEARCFGSSRVKNSSSTLATPKHHEVPDK